MGRKRESRFASSASCHSSNSTGNSIFHQQPKDPHHDEEKKKIHFLTLKKFTSWNYLSDKWIKKIAHKKEKKRDTIICEEDEENVLYHVDDEEEEKDQVVTSYGITRTKKTRAVLQLGNSSSSHEIIGCEELLNCCTRNCSWTSTKSSMMATKAKAVQERTEDLNYEPSKELRWCLNCSKCFQRKLSHYDQFCGLDCKTAYKFR
jgi:hypothetical protein